MNEDGMLRTLDMGMEGRERVMIDMRESLMHL